MPAPAIRPALVTAVAAMQPSLLRKFPAGRLRGRLLLAQEGRLATNPRDFKDAPTRIDCTFSGSTYDVIQRYIYVFGVWEPNITSWMQGCLRPGDVMVDIGANIGYYSMLAARKVGPSGRVVAFEPVADIGDTLLEQAAANGLTVDLRRQILSEETGTKTIYREVAGNLGHSNTVGGLDLVADSEVETVRGADVIERELWSRIRVVKIDVEGDELHVLRGLEPMLAGMSEGSSVIVEVTPADLESRGQTPADVVGLMRSLGYETWSVANDYEPASYAMESPSQPQKLLGIPAEKTDVIFVKGR